MCGGWRWGGGGRRRQRIPAQKKLAPRPRDGEPELTPSSARGRCRIATCAHRLRESQSTQACQPGLTIPPEVITVHPGKVSSQTSLTRQPAHIDADIACQRWLARTTARYGRTIFSLRRAPTMRCGSMASSSQPGGAEQPVLVPLLRWSSPAQVALPAVLRPARRFVPSAGRRDRERTRSAGQQVSVAAFPVVQPNGVGHMRR